MNIDLDKLVAKRIEEHKARLAEIAERNQRHETRRQEMFEEFVNGENSFKVRASKLLEILYGKYSPTRLHKLFRLDNWTNQQGLIILAGLHPANVEFDEEGKLVLPISAKFDLSEIRYKRTGFEQVKTLDNVQLFSSETIEILGAEVVANYGWDFKYRHSELLEIWESGNHSQNRYPPKYFIDWAISKNFDIEWLDWAIANDYYDAPQKEKDITLREVSPKSESAYLNIIGALVELYWAAAHEGQEYSQAALLAALKPYEGFAGMSERNLKEKLTLAMRAIKAS